MAVFTPVEPSEAGTFLEGYDLGRLVALDPVPEGVENTNYRLTTTTGVYALTLFEKRVDPANLPFQLGLMEHLAARGFPAPSPRRDRRGELVAALNGRPCAIVEWLPGAWPRQPNETHLRGAAKALGGLSRVGEDYSARLPNSLGPAGWRSLIARSAPRANGEDARMLAALDAEVSWLEARWPGGLREGPIHADYFPDNVLFVDGRVSGVIDFYFACSDFLAYDLAVALNAWGFSEDGSPDEAALDAFRTGYEDVRPLQPQERDALAVLCRGAAVRFTLTRLHDRLFHDATWQVTPKDPRPFFRRLAYFSA